MPDGSHPQAVRRPRLLFYAMVDPSGQDSAPKVRIALLGAALESIADVDRIQGGRAGRARDAWRWLQQGGLGRVDGIYVETSTTSASPFDLGFLALARLRGRRVGIYFRDAHQLYRDVFPRWRLRQRFGDLAWRIGLPVLRGVASVRYAPSRGLADVLGLGGATLLPPGTDPSSTEIGVSPGTLVVAVMAPTAAAGFDLLREAMTLVRRGVPDARLRIVTTSRGELPDEPWIEVAHGGRPSLPSLLADARVCVIPLPRTRYSDLAIPVRLADLAAFGKPLVVTESQATREFVGTSEAAAVVAATPEALSRALDRILRDDGLAARMGASARAFAEQPTSTWRHRATTVVQSLLEGPA